MKKTKVLFREAIEEIKNDKLSIFGLGLVVGVILMVIAFLIG